MGIRLLGFALLVIATSGCRYCGSGCYDYLPPVADGPHYVAGSRAGTAFGPDSESVHHEENEEIVEEFPDPAE